MRGNSGEGARNRIEQRERLDAVADSGVSKAPGLVAAHVPAGGLAVVVDDLHYLLALGDPALLAQELPEGVITLSRVASGEAGGEGLLCPLLVGLLDQDVVLAVELNVSLRGS